MSIRSDSSGRHTADWVSGSHASYVVSAALANAAILGLLLFMWMLHETDYDLFYRSVQEDEALEWATYWTFIGASGVFAMAALRQWLNGDVALPWYLAGVALFCFLVAMEEISWGQRVFTYRPPAYFLEHNFQQEFNVHNVISTDLRKLAVKIVLGVYGGLLPMLAAVPQARAWFDRLGIEVAPLAFLPSFGAALWIYHDYPWKYTGEIVELMMGLGFLFSALWIFGQLARVPHDGRRVAADFLVSLVCVAMAGYISASISHARKSTDPRFVEMAQAETEAMAADFEAIAERPGGLLTSSCNVHRRVYTYWDKYRSEELSNGALSGLTRSGMPSERAEFFLDPWNYPYWIRDRCADSDSGRPRRTFVYSFGPNMKRDTTGLELSGDDIGTYIYDTGPEWDDVFE